MPEQLDAQAALALAGEDVRDLGAAADVEAVTREHVQQAEQAAQAAEAKAAESEAQAVTGSLSPMTAAADRESARYSRLRAAVTARRAERHRQAERLRALDQAGQDALSHAGELPGIRDATEADLAAISELQAGIRERIGKWNAGLQEIADRAAGLDPEPLLPGGHARASSAHVWAGVLDTRPVVVTQGRTISGVDLGHNDGPVAAIGAAVREIRPHDPSERLYVAPNGLVLPVGRDAGGHIAKRIASGELHELTLGERRSYYAGGGAPHVS